MWLLQLLALTQTASGRDAQRAVAEGWFLNLPVSVSPPMKWGMTVLSS